MLTPERPRRDATTSTQRHLSTACTADNVGSYALAPMDLAKRSVPEATGPARRASSATRKGSISRKKNWGGRLDVVAMAVVSYLPLLATHAGMVPADTKQYLYLDPGQLLAKAPSLWDPSVGMGTVTHQNIGYLWPMGPWYWLFDTSGVPDWVAQRLWLGTLLFLAGLGVRYLMGSRGYRGWAVTAAAFVYLLSPYTLHYAARISALLMPWTALPWLIALTASALVRPRWWKASLIALIVATAGSVNLTSLLYVLIGPLLWILWSWIVLGETNRHRLWKALWPTALLGFATSAWSLAGLMVQGGFGVPIVGFTETLQAVSVGSAAQEVMRGLGYWFFYGNDNLGPWIEPAVDYTQHLWLIAASFGIVLIALAGATFSRFPERGFLLWMMLGGAVVAVGAHPWDSPTLAGHMFIDASRDSDAVLALRSTARAVPLVALSVSLLCGASVAAFADRTSHVFARRRLERQAASLTDPDPEDAGRSAADGKVRQATRLRRAEHASARLAGVGVIALALVAQPSLWTGDMVGSELQRSENLPPYWTAAADSISRDVDTRVWELPGIDFASYRWGNTVDPVTPGLTDRATVARELIPLGGSYPMDLLAAADRRLQEQVVDWDSIGPLAALMNADTLLVRNDLAFERYGTPRPEVLSAHLDDERVDLSDRHDFGTDVDLSADVRLGGHDETELGDLGRSDDVPAVFTVDVDNARNIHAAVPAVGGFVLDGAGEGIVDLAAQGALDRNPLVLYSHAVDDDALRQAVSSGAELVVSDSLRRQGRRWGSVRDNTGYTEQAGEEPLEYDPSDARLPGTSGWPAPDDLDMTVTEFDGPISQIQASDYGNVVSLTPGDRPALAVDNDVDTAWRVDAFGPAIGERLVIDLAEPTDVSALHLIQPLSGSRNRWITGLAVRIDDHLVGRISLERTSRLRVGQIVRFPTQKGATRIELLIEDTNVGQQLDYRRYSGVGFADVRIGVPSESGQGERWLPSTVEWTVLPQQTIGRLGRQVGAFSVLMSRRRGNEAEVTHPEEEAAMRRRFSVDQERAFAVEGAARLSPSAGEVPIDLLVGIPDDAGAASSGSLPGSIASRAHAAFDGDLATAWQTSFRTPVSGGFDDPVWLQYGSEDLINPAPIRFTILTDGRHSVPGQVTLEVLGDRNDRDGADDSENPDNSDNSDSSDNPDSSDSSDSSDRAATSVDTGGADGDEVVSRSATFDLDPPTDSELDQGFMQRTVEPGWEIPLHELRFSFSDVDPVESQGTESPLEVWFPLGIAEIQMTGVDPLPPPGRVNTCRDDLATLDGQPLNLRISGDGNDAVALEPMSVALCGASTNLTLEAGTHELVTVAGEDTGIDLDRIWLRSDRERSAPDLSATDRQGARVADLPVELTRNSSDHDTVLTTISEPTWIVLGESYNLGWSATAINDGARFDLGEPVVLNGFANAWLLDPATIGEGDIAVDMVWKPQRTVDRALALSAIGALVAIGVLVWDRRRDRTPAGALVSAASVSESRSVRWASILTVGGRPDRALIALGLLLNLVLMVFLSPSAVLVAFPIEVAAAILVRPRLLPAAALVAFTGATAVVIIAQWINRYPAQFDWPTRFPSANWLTNVALALLAASALWESRVRVHRRIKKRRMASLPVAGGPPLSESSTLPGPSTASTGSARSSVADGESDTGRVDTLQVIDAEENNHPDTLPNPILQIGTTSTSETETAETAAVSDGDGDGDGPKLPAGPPPPPPILIPPLSEI